MKMLTCRLLVLGAFALPSSAVAQNQQYTEDRLNQLQQSITMLTGQIEQLQYQNQQLQEKLQKMESDYEFRLESLEKGKPGAGGPRPPAPPPSASAGPPPAVMPPAAGAASGEQLYHDALKMLNDGDYAGAERGFKTFLQRNPQHQLAGNAQYWLGETYYARRDYQSAMGAFAEGYKVYKTSQKGPDNLLKLGITLAVLGRKSDACAVFQRFGQDYPRATDLQKRRADQERQKNGCG
ncbi:MAG TPA: tol-pal system protein YbgF [Reyranella sp.]|nr:tol-pal system protein YbgF [Reyranella sp.]